MAKRQEVFVIRHDNRWAVTRARKLSDGGTIHIQGKPGKFRTETRFD